MRIRTDGKFAYREEPVDDVADLLGENTRVVDVEYEVSTGVNVRESISREREALLL